MANSELGRVDRENKNLADKYILLSMPLNRRWWFLR